MQLPCARVFNHPESARAVKASPDTILVQIASLEGKADVFCRRPIDSFYHSLRAADNWGGGRSRSCDFSTYLMARDIYRATKIIIEMQKK